jgi:hypothetical protein
MSKTNAVRKPVVTVGAVFYLQYKSIIRQRRAVDDLTRSNLILLGERVAASMEKNCCYDNAEVLLRHYAAALQRDPRMRRLTSEGFRNLGEAVNAAGAFDQIFLATRNGAVERVFTDGPAQNATQLTELFVVLRPHDQGNVFPLAVTGPPPAQFFYMEILDGRYVVASVNLAGVAESSNNEAYILHIPNRIRIINLSDPPKVGEVVEDVKECTHDLNRRHLEMLIDHFGISRVEEITPESVNDWLGHLKSLGYNPGGQRVCRFAFCERSADSVARRDGLLFIPLMISGFRSRILPGDT